MQTLKNFISLQTFFLLIAFPLIIVHLWGISKFLSVRKQTHAYFNHDVGGQFAEFKPLLKNIPVVGFITNKDLSSEKNDGQFLMAQYVLAPTVLALNETQHRYNILDCTDKTSILYGLQTTHSTPIILNAYGKVLAEKIKQ